MSVFSFWSDLPPWLRYAVAISLMLISTAIYFLADRIWIWGWAAGVVLLFFAGPSDSEKKGYRF